jgi:hypothetical protein
MELNFRDLPGPRGPGAPPAGAPLIGLLKKTMARVASAGGAGRERITGLAS